MKRELVAFGLLVKRHTKIFLKDKAGVFFSLLAPMIVLLLYVLFLGDIQMSGVEAALDGAEVEQNVIRAFVDGWMLAGVLGTACITVSFSAQNLMIRDREEGIVADAYASPLKRWVLAASYFVYDCCVALVICGAVTVVAFVYLAISGWYLSVGDVFSILGLLFVSVVSAALFGTLVCSFLKTGNAHGAFVGILSAAVGFLIGAYMPLSMFPKAVQYLVLFLPGTYSASLFRVWFMGGALAEVAAVSPQGAEALRGAFTMNLDFFGTELSAGAMFGILAATVVLFAVADLLVARYADRRRLPLRRGKKGAAVSRDDS